MIHSIACKTQIQSPKIITSTTNPSVDIPTDGLQIHMSLAIVSSALSYNQLSEYEFFSSPSCYGFGIRLPLALLLWHLCAQTWLSHNIKLHFIMTGMSAGQYFN